MPYEDIFESGASYRTTESKGGSASHQVLLARCGS